MRRRTSGQSMVEMAFVLPFLIVMAFGIIEASYYIYTYSELENATRRASERASKTPPLSTTNPNNANDKCAQLAETDAIQGVFLSDLRPANIIFFFPPMTNPDGSTRPGERKVGDQIEVSINYTGSFLTPVGREIFSDLLQFQFSSRRTITSTDPPRGYKADCSPT